MSGAEAKTELRIDRTPYLSKIKE